MPKGEQDEARIAEARQRYDAALAEKVLALGDDRPELIVLAGWMYVFSAAFLEPMERAGIKIINLHPALPGKYSVPPAVCSRRPSPVSAAGPDGMGAGC